MSALFRIVVMAAIIVWPSTASAALDFTEFKQAVTNYFRALGSITNELPSVNSAAGTAKLIDAWTAANDAFATVSERFAAKHPEVHAMQEPPPELREIVSSLSRMKTDYAPLMTQLAPLMRRFNQDPAIQSAMVKFQQSAVRMERTGKPPQQK